MADDMNQGADQTQQQNDAFQSQAPMDTTPQATPPTDATPGAGTDTGMGQPTMPDTEMPTAPTPDASAAPQDGTDDGSNDGNNMPPTPNDSDGGMGMPTPQQ